MTTKRNTKKNTTTKDAREVLESKAQELERSHFEMLTKMRTAWVELNHSDATPDNADFRDYFDAVGTLIMNIGKYTMVHDENGRFRSAMIHLRHDARSEITPEGYRIYLHIYRDSTGRYMGQLCTGEGCIGDIEYRISDALAGFYASLLEARLIEGFEGRAQGRMGLN